MKIIYKSLPVMLIAFSLALSSCYKSNDNLSQEYNGTLSALVGKWTTSSFQGVSGHSLTFSIDLYSGNAVITQVNTSLPSLSVGYHIFGNIVGVTSTSYTAVDQYDLTGNQNIGLARNANITLQNNNTQMTVDVPAVTNYPEVIYIFQKTN